MPARVFYRYRPPAAAGAVILMVNFFSRQLLDARTKTITYSAAILAVSSIISKLLGIFRDWLLAEKFGAADLDIYFAAFRVPDFIYNILIYGGIVAAFLPLFSEHHKRAEREAWRFANNTLNVFLIFLTALGAILFIFAPTVVSWVAPGFSGEKIKTTVNLTRLMFLSPIIFGAASIFSGILQYFQRFLAYSLAPILYNLGIICGIILFSAHLGVTSAAIGVVLGALLYLAIQIPAAVRCGFRYQPIVRFDEPSLKQTIRLMIPRTIGVAADQFYQLITTAVASTLAVGSVAVFYLANNLETLPVGIIGVSWALAAFPFFSKYAADNDITGLAKKFSGAFAQITFIILPLCFLIFALRHQIVFALYFHGQFTQSSALLCAASLGIFCAGMYFDSIMPLIFRLFFALKDSLSPTISTIISVIVNVALNFGLVAVLQRGGELAIILRRFFGLSTVNDISALGLALAYSLATIVQFAVLVYFLWRKNRNLIAFRLFAVSFAKILTAGIIMFCAVAGAVWLMPAPPVWQIALIELAIGAVIGIAVFWVTAGILRIPELAAVKQVVLQQFLQKWKNNQK